eukprot:4562708-Pyramimonas_sp.AAC.1
MPMPEAMMGPMVEPQPMSLRTTKSCMGMPALFATSRNKKLVTDVVAYLSRPQHSHSTVQSKHSTVEAQYSQSTAQSQHSTSDEQRRRPRAQTLND